MMGEGDLPVKSVIDALRSINYEGYVSLEWVKRWAPGLEDAGIVKETGIYTMDEAVRILSQRLLKR